MKVKLANTEVIEKLQMKKKEKDSIRISDLKCERRGSFFEMSYKIFTKNGFEWGGDWQGVKDYQHFEWPGE